MNTAAGCVLLIAGVLSSGPLSWLCVVIGGVLIGYNFDRED